MFVFSIYHPFITKEYIVKFFNTKKIEYAISILNKYELKFRDINNKHDNLYNFYIYEIDINGIKSNKIKLKYNEKNQEFFI